MKTSIHLISTLSILTLCLVLLPNSSQVLDAQMPADPLRKAAFQILQQKCNSCHVQQYRFMIFKESNMDRKAKRIYQAVYVNQTMPKGEEIKLTLVEQETLKAWIFTQIEPE